MTLKKLIFWNSAIFLRSYETDFAATCSDEIFSRCGTGFTYTCLALRTFFPLATFCDAPQTHLWSGYENF